jgi:Sulfotransferase family
MSPIKEPHYFADEIRPDNFDDEMRRALREYHQDSVSATFSGGPISEWRDYLELFQHVIGETAIGEASVCYLWSKSAPKNIAAQFPEAKILIVLRDPVERTFSQYRHMLGFAKSFVSFREEVDAALRSTSTRLGRLNPFLEFGLHCEQVKRYFALFPREHVRIYFYEEYLRNPLGLLQDVFRFLSVEQSFVPDFSQKYLPARVQRSYILNRLLRRLGLWQHLSDLSPPVLRRQLQRVAFRPGNVLALDPADRARLVDFYRDDIRNLSSLLNRDLSHWLDGGLITAPRPAA